MANVVIANFELETAGEKQEGGGDCDPPTHVPL